MIILEKRFQCNKMDNYKDIKEGATKALVEKGDHQKQST